MKVSPPRRISKGRIFEIKVKVCQDSFVKSSELAVKTTSNES